MVGAARLRSCSPYREKCDAAGAHPDDLRSLEDLARFPFTTKQDLREDYPFGLFAVPREQVVRIHASSGTTGKPTVVGYTAARHRTWASLMARSIRAAGGRPGDIVHVAYGYGLFTGGLGAHYGAEKLGCTVDADVRRSDRKAGAADRRLQARRHHGHAVLHAQHRRGVRAPGSGSVQSSLQDRHLRRRAVDRSDARRHRAAVDIDAMDIYGLSEVIGPGVAAECIESKDGPAIWEDHFYPEIIDPDTGAVLPDGEAGELVFTSLTKEALPIIRYRTRDLTRLLPPTARSMRRMAKVTGRTDDMLIIRGVNVFPSQIEELISPQPDLAPHYVLEVRRERFARRVDRQGRAAPRRCGPRAGVRPGGRRARLPDQDVRWCLPCPSWFALQARSSVRLAKPSASSMPDRDGR